MTLPEANDRLFYSSVVVEHIVPKQKARAFLGWQRALNCTAERHAGFVRVDLCPPLECADGVVKFYSIVHFNTPEQLNHWLKSDERDRLMASGRRIVEDSKFISFTTGLEGWFSSRSGAEQSSLGPPAWKQVLAVVLGLYPIIMIQNKVFSALGLFQSWSPASAMLTNNLITSSILSWLVMPQITQQLQFWLRPAYQRVSRRTNLIGTAIVLALFGVMVAIFSYGSH